MVPAQMLSDGNPEFRIVYAVQLVPLSLTKPLPPSAPKKLMVPIQAFPSLSNAKG